MKQMRTLRAGRLQYQGLPVPLVLRHCHDLEVHMVICRLHNHQQDLSDLVPTLRHHCLVCFKHAHAYTTILTLIMATVKIYELSWCSPRVLKERFGHWWSVVCYRPNSIPNSTVSMSTSVLLFKHLFPRRTKVSRFHSCTCFKREPLEISGKSCYPSNTVKSLKSVLGWNIMYILMVTVTCSAQFEFYCLKNTLLHLKFFYGSFFQSSLLAMCWSW